MITGRNRMGRTIAWTSCLAGLALFGASNALGGVDIGGTPTHTEHDIFVGSGFEAEVFSFVYAGSDAELPNDPLFVPLTDTETLFVYFMANTGDTGDVDFMGLINEAGINPSALGISSLLPEGAAEETRVNPVVYDGSVSLVQYLWDEDFDKLLEPGEWTIMFYKITGFWQPVDGFVGLGADSDLQEIPGPAPIPEPAVLSLLLVGSFLTVGRRRRRPA